MTLRWLICFSACALLARSHGATVSGTVELLDSRDPAVRKKKDYSGVVVWLEPADKAAAAADGATRADGPEEQDLHARMCWRFLSEAPWSFPISIRSFTTRSRTTTGRSSMSDCIRPGSTRRSAFRASGRRAGVLQYSRQHERRDRGVEHPLFADNERRDGVFEIPDVRARRIRAARVP